MSSFPCLARVLRPSVPHLVRRAFVLVFCCVAGFALLAAPARAGEAAPLPPAQAEAVLQKLREQAAGVTTLQCRFAQEKRLSLFAQTVRSQGSFMYRRPDALRWEYTAPVSSGFVALGGKGAAWSRAGGVESRSALGENREFSTLAQQILPWLGFDEAALRKNYDLDVLSASPPVLRIVPKSEIMRRFLASLTITFDQKGEFAEEVRIQESEGDSTILRFSGQVINAPLADGVFVP